ncbi:MAG: glutaredoxin family protein [Betaproteobacteria bacterium]|jgi:glutaredoxin
MKTVMLLMILALACGAAQADVYRWVDADGEVHYSDQLPPATIKDVEKVKADGGKPSDAPWPYVLQQAVKNFPVTLYLTSCGDACTQASQLLAKRGIPYTEMDATDPATQEELKKLTGGNLEVPVLTVGGSTIRGFEAGLWNISLDAAGYPTFAVIAPPPPVKPAKPVAAVPPPAELPVPTPK